MLPQAPQDQARRARFVEELNRTLAQGSGRLDLLLPSIRLNRGIRDNKSESAHSETQCNRFSEA